LARIPATTPISSQPSSSCSYVCSGPAADRHLPLWRKAMWVTFSHVVFSATYCGQEITFCNMAWRLRLSH
jgi:hypothetical protein